MLMNLQLEMLQLRMIEDVTILYVENLLGLLLGEQMQIKEMP